MEEYKGRLNVSKDTMLFVVNTVLKNEIKENTTKENILKMIPEIYESEKDIDEFMKIFMEWYNNSPQYVLGGYSPIEFRKKLE